MPFLTIERGHGAVADHTIGVPVPGAPGDRVATDACTWCHQGGRGAPEDAPHLGAEEIRTAYARWWPDAGVPRPWMRAVAAARMGKEGAETALLGIAHDTGQPRLVRATAARLLERYADWCRRDLHRLTEDPDSLVRRNALLSLAALTGEAVDARFLEALSDPSQAVRVNAARGALAGWSRVRENAKLLEAVVPVLEEDVRSIPDDYYRWFLLGAARGLSGDEPGALAAYERVLQLDPLAHNVRRHVEELRKRVREGP
jgi:HEAT repeat protein